MTKEQITERAAEIENSATHSEAIAFQTANLCRNELRELFSIADSLRDKFKALLDEVDKQEREKLKALMEETKALRKELKALKNRENKPKGDRRITNASICRLLNISESILKARLLSLDVMNKQWGYMEPSADWKDKVRLAGLLGRNGKNRNVWVWTAEGRDKFIELHNKTRW